MFNLKKLMAAAVITTTTLAVTPVVLADDDDDNRRVYQQKPTSSVVVDNDDDDNNDRHVYKQNKVQYISKQKAIQIAKKRVKNSQVKQVQLDNDDGVASYKVELRTKSGVEYDVKINAKTGKIIKVDREDD